jgi:hypothetical protein
MGTDKIKKLNAYLEGITRRLGDPNNSPAKLAWIQLEIKRTKASLQKLILNKGV